MIDLNSLDRQHIFALLSIKEQGSKLPALLQAEAEEARRKLVRATDMVEIHRLQGRVEAFEDLLTAVEESPKVANRS
jgi:hypothetical protein